MPGHGPRLVLLDGVPLEAPLTGTILLFENNDQPGVIGQLGTILGKHDINIANFALGRVAADSAVGAVHLDEPTPVPDHVLSEIRAHETDEERLAGSRLRPVAWRA